MEVIEFDGEGLIEFDGEGSSVTVSSQMAMWDNLTNRDYSMSGV